MIPREEKKIKIVTGPVQSGKTSKLFAYINRLESVDGILAPIVDGKRMLYYISSKIIKELEVEKRSSATIDVGKYIFLKDSFDWANERLLSSLKEEPDWLIIDEIGKLELQKEGLHRSCEIILKEIYNSKSNLILVIRDYLINDVLKTYFISKDHYEIMKL
jgi:nucleoside-triphosphatase THEP1